MPLQSDSSSPNMAVYGELLSEIACFYWLPLEPRVSVSNWDISFRGETQSKKLNQILPSAT